MSFRRLFPAPPSGATSSGGQFDSWRSSILAGLGDPGFDDPNWFARTPKTSQHIFISSAQAGTIIPAGVKAYPEHTMRNDGTPLSPVTFEDPHVIVGEPVSAP